MIFLSVRCRSEIFNSSTTTKPLLIGNRNRLHGMKRIVDKHDEATMHTIEKQSSHKSPYSQDAQMHI
ncbi:Hypothetical predicted protein [Octopus vulgaris]|uniref:Uncharacterized protein n=1 Tax=Octopus vulgaris TaxID=6645 RepID=A0AA36BMI0_OCTVU|nr:Hypothetical predicted protein [Octopus vulgaris]